MGKSALLDEFYRRLIREKPENFFVGYFDEAKVLLGASSIYQFVTLLEDLLRWIKNTEQINDKIKGTMKRIVSAVVEFGKEKGKEMAGAILQDIATRLGLANTFEILKDFLAIYGGQKTADMLAEDYISKNQTEAVLVYLGIFQALAKEFNDRKFILIFDKFETSKKASIDFLVNFVNRLPDKFHVIVSYRSEDESTSNEIASNLYEYSRKNLVGTLGKPLVLTGLSEQAIGEWIKSVRQVELPLSPHLVRIRQNSAGFPMLLNEWINQSEDLNYNDVSRDKLCEYISARKRGLGDNIDDKVRLNKMAVLIQPLSIKELSELLDTRFDYLPPFIEKLVNLGFFKKRNGDVWFNHELVQRCLEDKLDPESKQMYHENAAKLYLRLFEEDKKEDKDKSYRISIGCAYHLHEAAIYEQSYIHNRDLANYAADVGDIVLAEECYLRAFSDAEQLGDSTSILACAFNLTSRVYTVWGRYDHALRLCNTLLDLFSKNGHQEGVAKTLALVANIYKIQGEYDDALKLYNQSLGIFEQIGDKRGRANGINELAEIYFIKGQLDDALKLYNQSLGIFEQIGDKQMAAGNSMNVATIYKQKGQLDDALKLYNQSLGIFEQIGDKRGRAKVLHQIALIRVIEEQYDEALKLYNQSLDILKQIGDQTALAKTLMQMGILYHTIEQYDEALKLYQDSLAICKKTLDVYGVGVNLSLIGKILIKQGNYDKALPSSLIGYIILKKINYEEAKQIQPDLDSIKDAIGEEKFKNRSAGIEHNIPEPYC